MEEDAQRINRILRTGVYEPLEQALPLPHISQEQQPASLPEQPDEYSYDEDSEASAALDSALQGLQPGSSGRPEQAAAEAEQAEPSMRGVSQEERAASEREQQAGVWSSAQPSNDPFWQPEGEAAQWPSNGSSRNGASHPSSAPEQPSQQEISAVLQARSQLL